MRPVRLRSVEICSFCGEEALITHELDGEPMCGGCAKSDDWDETPEEKARIKEADPDVGF